MPSVTCPACERSYNLAESTIGKSVICKCGVKFKVPEPVELPPIEAPISPSNEPLKQGPTFKAIEPHTEANLVALLIQIVGFPLAGFGALGCLLSLQADFSVLALAPPVAMIVSGLVLAGFGFMLKIAIRIQQDTQRTQELTQHIAFMLYEAKQSKAP